MKRLLCFFLLLTAHRMHANDGSFYASGNTLIPLKETVIRLKKEVLDLTYNGAFMQVNIYFEFFNPGEAKELTVGFVTPPAAGDVRDDEIAHPQVKDFFVMVDKTMLSYKIAKMEGTGFKIAKNLADGNDFVYYFTVKFKKGITVIRHSYAYRGSTSVENIYDYGYRLTTGTSWAGGAIEDFELNIRIEDDRVFGVPFQFNNRPAEWEIIGIGKLGLVPKRDAYGDAEDQAAKLRPVYIKRGFLQLKARTFKPESDLSIVITALHNEINWWCENAEENDFTRLNDLYIEDSVTSVVKTLSDDELKMFRNLDYARNGYDFRDSVLKKAFSKYIWYIPDPAFKIEKTFERYIGKRYLDLITAEEKRRKKF